jgi:hypothetical protein
MKKILLLACAFAFTTIGVSGQSAGVNYSTGQQPLPPNLEQRAKDETDKLNNLVELSQDQYNQVLQVNRSFFSQHQASGNGRGAARLAAGREQQFKSILTSDQWQRLQNAKVNGQY